MTSTTVPLTRHVPIAAARRRYGLSLLALALLGLLLVTALLLAQVPPSLRASTVTLILILVLVFVGTAMLSIIWTWVAVWPPERRRLAGAAKAGRLSELPPCQDRSTLALAVALGGGLLVGGLLWTVLSTLGFVGAPLLWCTLGALNLELARLVQRVERRQGAVYYEVPVSPLSGASRRLFVLTMM